MVGNFALTLMAASGQMDPSDVVAAEYTIPWNYNNGALAG